MADRYWVGGSGTWNTSSTTNWSASPGGASGASVPTSADSVFFDQAGTYTVTLTGALNCLDFNVSAGAVTFSSTGTISIAGSVSITNVTPTWSATGTLTFTATTAKTITSNGTTFSCPMTFDGVGGSWQLLSALTTGATRTVTLTNGTLNLNNFTLTTGLFASANSNVRTIAFGTGNITTTGTGSVWFVSPITNLTLTGTPVVNVNNNTATATSIFTGAPTLATAFSFNFVSGTYTLAFLAGNGSAARNVNFTGFSGTWSATGAATVFGSLTLSTGMTLTTSASALTFGATSGTSTITTNGKTVDFPLTFNGVGGTFEFTDALTLGSTRAFTVTNGVVKLKNGTTNTVGSFATGAGTTQRFLQSTVAGSQATITDPSGTNAATYLTVQDIAAAGGATWNAFAANNNVDAGNNSGWNFGLTPQYAYEYPIELRSFTERKRF